MGVFLLTSTSEFPELSTGARQQGNASPKSGNRVPSPCYIGTFSLLPLGFLFAVYRHVGTNIPRNADGGASEYDNVCFTSFVVSPSPASVYPIVRSSSVLDCIAFISLFFLALRGKEIRISEG